MGRTPRNQHPQHEDRRRIQVTPQAIHGHYFLENDNLDRGQYAEESTNTRRDHFTHLLRRPSAKNTLCTTQYRHWKTYIMRYLSILLFVNRKPDTALPPTPGKKGTHRHLEPCEEDPLCFDTSSGVVKRSTHPRRGQMKGCVWDFECLLA